MRWARPLLRMALVLALVPLAAGAWLYYRYRLDYGSAITKALRSTARYTIDADRLREARFSSVRWLGSIANRGADEISGLAASRRRDDLLWAVNDSGDGPFLYALGSDGRDRGVVYVKGAVNVDWEALAAFVLDGEPYLLIADVGDNFGWRPAITLYLVPEPALNAERFEANAAVAPKFVLRARYPDGPEDCEAVAVDAGARRVLLLSKRMVPPVLYALDLEPRHDHPRALEDLLVARRFTAVPGIPQPTAADLAANPQYGALGSRPTALDVSSDGRRAIVFTYKEGYLFERGPGEGWAQAFARDPKRVRTPLLRAMEAGAFARDGRTLYVTSEFLPAPLYRFDP